MTFKIPEKIIDDIGKFWQFSAMFANDQMVFDLYKQKLHANLSWIATKCDKEHHLFLEKIIPLLIQIDLNAWIMSQQNYYLFQYQITPEDDLFYFSWKVGFSDMHTITFKVCTPEELDRLYLFD